MADSNGVVTPHSNGVPLPVLLGPDGQPLRGRDKDTRASGLSLPHSLTFIARQSGGMGTYWHDRFDECLRFNREYAENMRNDGFLNGLLQERMLAVYSLRHSWHLEIPNEKDPFQVRVRDAVTAVVKGIPFLGRMMWSWLESIWFGKYAAQVQWGWRKSPDPQRQKALTVLDWVPVQGDKIGHQFFDQKTGRYVEQPYVLIDAAYSDWLQKRENARIITTTLGQALVLQGNWRERFIIHKHLVEDSDWFHSDKAEAIHGVGVRSKIFWSYWLRMEWLANVTDFFDRVGLGVTVWKYPQGNQQALTAVQKAANEQQNRAHIFVPIAPDSGKDQSGIERIEVPTSGADFLQNLIEYLDGIIERYVVGQEASSKGVSAGMGNEATADFQEETKRKITLLDADFLAETITGSPREPGLIDTIVRYSYPEADFPVHFCFDLESGESEKKLTAIKTVVDLGVNVKASEVRRAAGLSKPIDGDEVVQGQQQGAMPGMPGMPGAAPAGPGGIPQPGEGGGNSQQTSPEATTGAGGEEATSTTTPMQGETPGGTTESPPGGFLDSLRYSRPVAWEKAGGVSPQTGLPYKTNGDTERWESANGTVKHFPVGRGPGDRQPEAKSAIPQQGGKPQESDPPPTPSEPSVADAVAEEIKALGEQPTAEDARSVAEKLSGLTVGELRQLAQLLGWDQLRGRKVQEARELARGTLEQQLAG